jgi:nitrogen PTS system EIIA component
MAVKNTQETYLTLQEVADRVRVCDKTIRRWLQSGQIEATKPAGQWRFEESEVKRFIAARKRVRDRQVPRVKRTYTRRKAS